MSLGQSVGESPGKLDGKSCREKGKNICIDEQKGIERITWLISSLY